MAQAVLMEYWYEPLPPLATAELMVLVWLGEPSLTVLETIWQQAVALWERPRPWLVARDPAAPCVLTMGRIGVFVRSARELELRDGTVLDVGFFPRSACRT